MFCKGFIILTLTPFPSFSCLFRQQSFHGELTALVHIFFPSQKMLLSELRTTQGPLCVRRVLGFGSDGWRIFQRSDPQLSTRPRCPRRVRRIGSQLLLAYFLTIGGRRNLRPNNLKCTAALPFMSQKPNVFLSNILCVLDISQNVSKCAVTWYNKETKIW